MEPRVSPVMTCTRWCMKVAISSSVSLCTCCTISPVPPIRRSRRLRFITTLDIGQLQTAPHSVPFVPGRVVVVALVGKAEYAIHPIRAPQELRIAQHVPRLPHAIVGGGLDLRQQALRLERRTVQLHHGRAEAAGSARRTSPERQVHAAVHEGQIGVHYPGRVVCRQSYVSPYVGGYIRPRVCPNLRFPILVY